MPCWIPFVSGNCPTTVTDGHIALYILAIDFTVIHFDPDFLGHNVIIMYLLRYTRPRCLWYMEKIQMFGELKNLSMYNYFPIQVLIQLIHSVSIPMAISSQLWIVPKFKHFIVNNLNISHVLGNWEIVYKLQPNFCCGW